MYNVTEESNASPNLCSGYDIPVYGLANGSFYYIHIPAIVCIVSSFICAVAAIVMCFRHRGCGTFFRSWTKTERLVVYLAFCDALFNVFHFTDHLHITIIKGMVYPKQLCEFYGFNLAIAVTSQMLMVNVVAINAFMLIYFDKNMRFGKRDWKLLAWTFGVPAIGAIIAVANGQMGPNGTFCAFDGVKGRVTNIVFSTAPMLIILFMNIVLYVLTWTRIHKQVHEIKHTLGTMSVNMKASHRSARAMSMFVAAFFIQWWAPSMFAVWGLVTEDVPQVIFHLVTIFPNIGGILNLVVYMFIRRGKSRVRRDSLSTVKRSSSGESQDESQMTVISGKSAVIENNQENV